jgi:hypothetical protein
MEKLFSTTLMKGDQTITYDVHFEQDRYEFVSQDGSDQFGIKREEDEWHMDQQMEKSVSESAIKALDDYLLSQH